MGIADVIPGVSGGTIALITGVYQELIDTINNLNISKFKLLIHFKYREFWISINGNFILSIFSGILISIIIFSGLIKFFINEYPIQLWSFFFGLILSSVFYLLNKVKPINSYNIFLILTGIILAYSLTLLSPSNEKISLSYLFFSSIIAIIAMILPGISGAFIFILLGVYELVIETVKNSFKILLTLDLNLISSLYSKLLVIILGMIIGLKIFSKTLKWLFKNYKNQTLSFLIGIMIGALPKIWPWKKNNIINELTINSELISPFNFKGDNEIELATFFMIFGFLILFIFEYCSKKTKIEFNKKD